MHERRASYSLPWLLVFLVTATFAAPSDGQTRPFTAEDMLALVGISGDIAVSPEGDRLAYVLPDLADEWNVGARPQRAAVYVQRIAGTAVGRPVRVGLEGQWSSLPTFSPDGKLLAFYVADADGGRLAVWESDSGQRRRALHGNGVVGTGVGVERLDRLRAARRRTTRRRDAAGAGAQEY